VSDSGDDEGTGREKNAMQTTIVQNSAAVHRRRTAGNRVRQDGGPWPAYSSTRMSGHRWLTGVAVTGALASVLAAAMLWLVATRPDAVAMTLGMWLGAAR
jgi:hypothetical protein